MNDKIVGRPIRLNKRRLNVKSGKNYADMLLIGDVHAGSPQCDIPRFLAQLDDRDGYAETLSPAEMTGLFLEFLRVMNSPPLHLLNYIIISE